MNSTKKLPRQAAGIFLFDVRLAVVNSRSRFKTFVDNAFAFVEGNRANVHEVEDCVNQIIRSIRSVDSCLDCRNFFGITFAKFFRRPNKRGNFNHVDVARFLHRVSCEVTTLVDFFSVVGNVNQDGVFIFEAADNFVDDKSLYKTALSYSAVTCRQDSSGLSMSFAENFSKSEG